ncbi:MAG: FAD-dependent monooxygenase [Streptosporangiaceae bacterium]|jgi:2-polyprenyl-6-methoxyphenol hydroxylase-like FAD-dependent oxidoreductase
MNSDNHIPQVLVVGAGIAGLAVAGAIRELGWAVSSAEQRQDLDVTGTGLFIPANGIRALAALGMLDAVTCRGHTISRLRVRSGDGSVESVARLEKVWPAIGPSIAIHRSLIQQILLDAALVPVRMGARLAGLTVDGAMVHATFDDGDTAGYDLVVGADGAGSAVRGLLWPDAAVRYGGESWWRGIVPCPPGLADWTLTLCQAGNLVIIPVGNGLAYWGAGVSHQAPFHDEPAGRAARVRDRFTDATGVAAAVLDQVTDDDPVQFSAADTAWTEDPVAGRVVLIGDAWHAATPSMAQGAAMAAEDALVLAQELGRDPRHGAIGGALRRFAARRLPRVRHVQETTAMRNQLAALPLEQRLGVIPHWEDISVASFAPLVSEP